ncbi:LysR family transcriptional regulator [Bacillus mesophilum]|uniref:LysR family transcriptional regulator n=1 Tax=Bacillus mesophilum TaxID=1071718 RepID=A0A7V7RIU0_9BACI|nr:LysR family transcriptional regulator [Bacillus mesophilum]KAB2330343.1 LysR family transcriptional regulator [Bacillus mesophilum]
MDIRQLKYFETLVRRKNFTKAAEELFISQPSLTNTIKQLEKELEFKLFERTTRIISLTESGEIFYNHVISILQVYNLALKDMEEIKLVGKGIVTIGVIESSRFWLPKIIRSFSVKYPEIKINFKNIIRPKDVETALVNYDIHFAITTHPITNPNLERYELFQEEFVILLPAHHPLSKDKSIDLSMLEDDIFIQFSNGYQIRDDFLKICYTAGFKPKGLYEVDDFETAFSLVENGLGVALIPESYFKYTPKKLDSISYLRLINPAPIRKVYISFHQKRYLTPAAHELITLVQEFFEGRGENQIADSE